MKDVITHHAQGHDLWATVGGVRLSKGEGLELGLPRYRKPRDIVNILLRFRETQMLGNNSSHQAPVE